MEVRVALVVAIFSFILLALQRAFTTCPVFGRRKYGKRPVVRKGKGEINAKTLELFAGGISGKKAEKHFS